MKGCRFPRTLTEAFGPDASSACAVERFRPSKAPRLVLFGSLVIAAASLILILVGGGR